MYFLNLSVHISILLFNVLLPFHSKYPKYSSSAAPFCSFASASTSDGGKKYEWTASKVSPKYTGTTNLTQPAVIIQNAKPCRKGQPLFSGRKKVFRNCWVVGDNIKLIIDITLSDGNGKYMRNTQTHPVEIVKEYFCINKNGSRPIWF